MLVLTRKTGERIIINDDIVVEVLEVQGNRVRIGIQAPSDVSIMRQELTFESSPTGSPAGRGHHHLHGVS